MAARGWRSLCVGHAIGEHATAELAVGVLELAIGRRRLVVDDHGGLVCHTDQGSTYTAAAFSKRLEGLGIRASMGRSVIASTTPWSRASTPRWSVS